MAANRRKKLATLLDSAKLATDIPTKLDHLRQLKHDLVQEDAALLSDFLPGLLEFQSDRFSPVRKLAAEYAPQFSCFCSVAFCLFSGKI